MKVWQFREAYTATGWQKDCFITVDAHGIIAHISQEKPREGVVEYVDGFAIVGFQNAHSHAFQYALAGLAEPGLYGKRDNFWRWREMMYDYALALTPDQLEHVATSLYTQLVINGYTSVAEFHYLHHDPAGKPYAHRAEMGERLMRAAKASGIRLTLIPIWYQQSNFGVSANAEQRRFLSETLDEYWQLLAATQKVAAQYPNVQVGVGIHSLRAVALKDIRTLLQHLPSNLPFHCHIAEQAAEVDACIQATGLRPIEWLMHEAILDEKFNLIHATQITDSELISLAHSKANIVLCPSTEANLADGIFPFWQYQTLGGKFSIGSDSQVVLSPIEELRWLDYIQRLIHRSRSTTPAYSAEELITAAYFAGAQAMGHFPKALFAMGSPMECVILNPNASQFNHCEPMSRLAKFIYAGNRDCMLGTIVGDRWVYQTRVS